MAEHIVPRLRTVFRELARGITVHEIDQMWQDEGFAPGEGNVYSGVRMSLWSDYEATVDWASWEHVTRVLRVYEEALPTGDSFASERATIAAHLHRNGYRLTDYGRIEPAADRIAPLEGLAALREPSGIQNAFGRISLLLDTDPVGAIGTAKELVEATAKTVLEHVGETYGSSDDVPALIKRAQTALGLHNSTIDRSIPRADALAKILGGLTAIALGVNEFRNANGSGHGRATVASGVGARHARLTVNAARTWCETMLETLADPTAPWRQTKETADDEPDH